MLMVLMLQWEMINDELYSQLCYYCYGNLYKRDEFQKLRLQIIFLYIL